MRHATLAATLTLIALTPAPGLSSDRDHSYRRSTDAKEIGWMDRGMEMVKAKLKDPDSAKFKDVFFNRGSDNIPLTCGQVNSKNSLGGYGGYQRFVSGGSAELTFVEEQVAGSFAPIWKRFCE